MSTEIDNILAPFCNTLLCAFTNIRVITQENQVVGYEYVNEKTMKEWWNTYGVGDLLRSLEYWPEQCIKEYSTQNICNYRPQYIKQITVSCTVILFP